MTGQQPQAKDSAVFSERGSYKIRAYITKYALTNGILEVEGEASKDRPGVLIWRQNRVVPQTVHGKDWYRSLEEAVKRAEEMRIKKIASLKKQIAKLETLEF